MDIPGKLSVLGLGPDDAIVIGSGILNALSIRPSNDIDLVVTQSVYDRLKQTGRFSEIQKHGRLILTNETFEIFTVWRVLGKDQTLGDMYVESIVIAGVRYITLDFLLAVKQAWVKEGTDRPKDSVDIELMLAYKKQQTTA